MPFLPHLPMSSTISTYILSMKAEFLDKVLASLRLNPVFDAVGACALVWVFLAWMRVSRQRLRTTKLRGPPSESFLYGIGSRIFDSKNPGDIYEAWAREYGPVFEVPSTLGSRRVVLCDPKAIAHFYAKETWTYIQTPTSKKLLENSVSSLISMLHTVANL